MNVALTVPRFSIFPKWPFRGFGRFWKFQTRAVETRRRFAEDRMRCSLRQTGLISRASLLSCGQHPILTIRVDSASSKRPPSAPRMFTTLTRRRTHPRTRSHQCQHTHKRQSRIHAHTPPSSGLGTGSRAHAHDSRDTAASIVGVFFFFFFKVDGAGGPF